MKKLFYITLISGSLITVVFFNGKIIVLNNTDGDNETLILKEEGKTALNSFKTSLFKNNIEKYVEFINSTPSIIALFTLLIFFKLYLEELFANTITIRGPPVKTSKHPSVIILKYKNRNRQKGDFMLEFKHD